LELGATCTVIGLGLVGLLTLQLLEASGVRSIGIDIDQNKVDLANSIGYGVSYNRNQVGLDSIISRACEDFGVDSVIITAGSSSLDPVNYAGEICRKKGSVIIVGSVPTGFDRKNYYRKELDLKMSSSYGPGRYDIRYEEKGEDYPVGYVRWTENRNMQAFLNLIAAEKIKPAKLISHEFTFNNAIKAFGLLMNKDEIFAGIVLKYPEVVEIKKLVSISEKTANKSNVKVGFIGAGKFAGSYLLPNLQNNVDLNTVCTGHGHNATYTARKFGFKEATTDYESIFSNKRINTVFIATRHNLHSSLVKRALTSNKHVFVEKPLCLREEELIEIRKLYLEKKLLLMVGYNRRFSKLVERIKTHFDASSPKAINYRINAGKVPPDHWVKDPEVGGGRILGEVCHFIDLCLFLAGSNIKSIYASSIKNEIKSDTLVINLEFTNGSIASISYFSNGNNKLPKEYLEIFSGGDVAILDDFKKLLIYGKKQLKVKIKQDKGHKVEVFEFLSSIVDGKKAPISFDDIFDVSLATFNVIE